MPTILSWKNDQTFPQVWPFNYPTRFKNWYQRTSTIIIELEVQVNQNYFKEFIIKIYFG